MAGANAPDAESLAAIITAAVTAATDNIQRNSTADNRAIVEAAVAAAMAGQQRNKKPSLPAFDPRNMDTWLRCMNAAFDRLSITDAKLKFSHVDEKIPSDTDPIINDFMCGAQTDDRWTEFVKYLRQKHGKTIRERAYTVIQGTDREGRTPSQLWSIMMDRQGKATIDDVQKEQLLRRLPQDVLRHLESKGIDSKTGKEVAAMADVYYDKSGKLKHSSTADVNSVRPQLPSAMKTASTSASPTRSSTSSEASGFTTAFDDTAEVNAVRFKQGQRQRFDVSNGSGSNQRSRSQSRGRSINNSNSSNDNNNSSSNNNNNDRYSANGGRFNGNRNNSSNRGNNNNNNASKPTNKVCFYHVTYGDRARSCEEGCMLWAQHSAKGRATH